MGPKPGIRGAPFDIVLEGWFVDYADPISFFNNLNGHLKPTDNLNFGPLRQPEVEQRDRPHQPMSGRARAIAWADLDVEMMRDDPPWAPFMTPAGRDFVSASLGCYLYHPVYGFDFAAACKK